MSQATKGQEHRYEIRVAIEQDLAEFCPDTIDNLASRIAYKENLTPDTVKYNYLKMFKIIGFIIPCGDGKYNLAKIEEKNHTADSGTESLAEYAKKHPRSKTCKNCNKPIVDCLTFCNNECMQQYKEKHNE
jgi:hypothetical protein